VTPDGSGRSREDLLFVFWAAYSRVPTEVGAWQKFFQDSYHSLFAHRPFLLQGFVKICFARLSYSYFRKNFVAVLKNLKETHRVEFALRHADPAKLMRQPSSDVGELLVRVEQDVLDRYFTEYLVACGDGFLQKHFAVQRSLWLRESLVRTFPFAALLATAVISVYAIFAMQKNLPSEEWGLFSWISHIRAIFE
jgi:hypothetical protein